MKVIKPIKININDLKKINLVALLVDREDFLTDISMVRDTIKLNEVPYKFPTSKFDEVNKTIDAFYKGKFTIYETYLDILNFCNKQHIYLSELDYTLAHSVTWAQILAHKYRNSNLYLPVILATILVGEVTIFDLNSTYIETLTKERILELYEELNDEELNDEEQIVTIRVHRESSQQEVKETFSFIQEYIFGTKKAESPGFYDYYKEHRPKNTLPNTISRIKRDRRWYLLRKEGKTISEICDLSPKKDGRYYDEKTIDGAIRQYKDRLEIPLELFS